MAQNVHGTFVSEKISKIRWRTDHFDNSQNFVTGSWDNENNKIKLWAYTVNEENDIYPFELGSYGVDGDVTELKFINQDLLVASTSFGSVYLLRLTNRENDVIDITEQVLWHKIHSFNTGVESPCTALSIYEEDVATVGEDGRLNLLTTRKEQLIRSIDNADSCSLNCVTFLKFNEVLTGNLRGQMKIWDLRKNDDSPTSTFMLNDDQIAPTTLTYHPTQRHMVLAGDEEGSLTVWDLRLNTFPVTLLSAHSEAVSEIKFHPDNPEHLFSCSHSGELWHWSTVNQSKLSLFNENSETVSPWFSNENIKNKLEVVSLMPKLHKPINSLDIDRNKLLCGCDNEAVYVINNIKIN